MIAVWEALAYPVIDDSVLEYRIIFNTSKYNKGPVCVHDRMV